MACASPRAMGITQSDPMELTEEQIVIIGATGAAAALIILTLIAIIYALVYNRRHHSHPPRLTSQVSVARSDFWPFSTVRSPPPTLKSPNHDRHVFFEDDLKSCHTQEAPIQPDRRHSVATIDRDFRDMTSRDQPRSRATSESDLMAALYSPFYVKLVGPNGTLINGPRHPTSLHHFNRGALAYGRDPFLWNAGSWEDPR